MGGMAPQDEVREGSSSVTTSSSSTPLQYFSLMSISSASPVAAWTPTPSVAWPPPEMKSDERGLYLIHLLLNCVDCVAAGDLDRANASLEHIALLGASADGDTTMQRIAALLVDALARRLLRSTWPGIFRAIAGAGAPRTPPARHLAHRHFFDLCPFLKVAHVVANQAILEAMEGERVVHLIDLHAANPAPLVALLQALSVRPEGAPHLRITAVHDQKEVLDHVAARLSEEAENLDIPFQFNAVVSKVESLDPERSLRVKTGEALAICSVLQLHRLLAPDGGNCVQLHEGAPMLSSKCSAAQLHLQAHRGTFGEVASERFNGSGVSPVSSPQSTRMEAFLAGLWKLAPKVMVVVEQESNHNGAALTERFTEALNYYAALFDCLESAAAAAAGGGAAHAEERELVERVLLGEEIRDIIANEGAERRERHERHDRWLRRLDAAGFERVPLSYYALLQARRLLQHGYGACGGYGVLEEAGGCHAFCWQNCPLYFASAWRCRRFA